MAWRLWLRLANLLGSRSSGAFTEILTVSEAAELSGNVAATGATGLSVEWNEALEFADESDREFLLKLAGIPDFMVPEIGLELGDGIPVEIAWSEQQVAVARDLDERDVKALEAAGWVVVEASVDAVMNALKLER